MNSNIEKQLQDQVIEAKRSGTALAIFGGGSKSFYGREIIGEPLHTEQHHGVIDYHPTELVITARGGTTLKEIIEVLDENNQMLGFEPPQFTQSSTLGGAIAAGLSGPIRPFSGLINHFVLGIKVLTGRGEVLRFGGQVIKNVAGFDVSRLLVGSLGCLGIILEVSVKVIPKPASRCTVVIDHADPNESIALMNTLAGKPLPISGAAWLDGKTRIRISGSESGVREARDRIGQGVDNDGDKFWNGINNQTDGFFDSELILLRGSVAPGTQYFCEEMPQLIDWGGGLRWIKICEIDDNFQNSVKIANGHLSCFRNGDRKGEVFAPLSSAIMKFNQKLKKQFDPEGILNPGRMYAGF